MWTALCMGLLSIIAVTGQVALEQHIRELTVREGAGVTFQCSMSGDRMSSYYMYWYRQEPGGFLEWIYREGDRYGEGFEGRFKGSVESSQNRFTLQIQAAKQGDEAVYFCGARMDYVTPGGWSTGTDKLVFGSGTDLTVEPNNQKSSNPEVILMKSKKQKDGSTGKAACLARNFYTKNINLEMSSDVVLYEPSTSILTSEGLYDTIKVVNVSKDQEVNCVAKFDDKTIADNSTLSEEAEEQGTLKVCNTTDTSVQDTKVEKANMLSMAVLGLRVLLAKSIAFNTLMSIKLFLF